MCVCIFVRNYYAILYKIIIIKKKITLDQFKTASHTLKKKYSTDLDSTNNQINKTYDQNLLMIM